MTNTQQQPQPKKQPPARPEGIAYEDQKFSIQETAGDIRCSVSYVWKLVRQGKLKPARIGGRTLITGSEIRRLVTESTDQ